MIGYYDHAQAVGELELADFAGDRTSLQGDWVLHEHQGGCENHTIQTMASTRPSTWTSTWASAGRGHVLTDPEHEG
jgi:hypothetical protein